jgi:methionine aminotransferase
LKAQSLSKARFRQLFPDAGYKGITNEKDTEFAIRLTKEVEWLLYLLLFLSSWCGRKMLRFCFAKEKETLEQAAERLMKV